MKKFIKSNLKTIVLIIIMNIIYISGITFAALKYSASQVEYENEKSVEEALNELYYINLKGNILFDKDKYDTQTMTPIKYTFTTKTQAILLVNTVHGNNNSKYYHQLNTPSITNGTMKKIYSIGKLNTQISGGDILSEYAYLIKANEGTTVTVNAKAYGWGYFRIKIIN